MSRPDTRLLLFAATTLASTVWAASPARARAPLRPGQTHMITRSVSLATPSMGPRHAPVTLWLWSSFRLYHMQGLRDKLKELMKLFPGQIRILGLHRSRGYADEDIIAQIAREAYIQGGSALYWKVHDALTSVQQIYQLNAAQATNLAVQAGVNKPLLEKALKNATHRDTIDEETMLLMTVGESPTSYDVPVLINTQLYRMRRYNRAQDAAVVVKQELAKAQQAMKSGVAPERIADWALQKAKQQARFRIYPYYRYRWRYRAYPSPLTIRTLGVGTKGPLRRYHVPVHGAPTRGNPLAVVTAVLFADLRNYYSQMAWKQLLDLETRFKGRLRLAVRMIPTATDRYADWTARLAISAHMLGKFWEVAKEIVKTRYIYPQRLKQLAEKAGLDLQALKTRLKSQEVKDRLNQDRRMAARVGVYQGPVVFINGRRVRSLVSPYARFLVDAVIREELKPGLLTRVLGDGPDRPILP